MLFVLMQLRINSFDPWPSRALALFLFTLNQDLKESPILAVSSSELLNLLNQGSSAGLLATLFHLLRRRTGEDGWGVSGGWRGTGRDPKRFVMLLAGNEESGSPPPHQEAITIKKDGNIKNLSCKEKHSSFHEGNEIRGNCETRRFNQT